MDFKTGKIPSKGYLDPPPPNLTCSIHNRVGIFRIVFTTGRSPRILVNRKIPYVEDSTSFPKQFPNQLTNLCTSHGSHKCFRGAPKESEFAYGS